MSQSPTEPTQPRFIENGQEEFLEYTPEGSLTLDLRLEAARVESHRLEPERELALLKAQNLELCSSRSPPTVVEPPAIDDIVIVSPLHPIKAKTFRPDKMRSYKGGSEGEHVHIKFLINPNYFKTDQSKVVYYMQSLKDDPFTQ